MDTTNSKALLAALQSQSENLANISDSLHRLVLLESIRLTPEQRREMTMTDEIIAKQGADILSSLMATPQVPFTNQRGRIESNDSLSLGSNRSPNCHLRDNPLDHLETTRSEGKMKTLKLTVYLWRDGLPVGTDCWDSGMVYVPAEHRKNPGKGTLFNSPAEMGAAMKQELKGAGLVPASS